MNKSYEVTIKLMVIAIDKDDARYAARDIDLYACDFEAKEITDINGCLPGWETQFHMEIKEAMILHVLKSLIPYNKPIQPTQ